MYLSRRALIAAGLTLLDVTTAQAATFPCVPQEIGLKNL